MWLERFSLGDFDPNQLTSQSSNQELITRLFSGAPGFRKTISGSGITPGKRQART
jgi:hypothetical protein